MVKRTSSPKAPSSRASKTAAAAPLTETAPEKASVKVSGYLQALPIVAALVLVVGGGAYFVDAATKSKTANDLSGSQVPDTSDINDVSSIIDRVRELAVVESTEKPTVATVQDISLLRTQNATLYRDAENGDKLLVWPDKIIVYSPSKDRILVVVPINTSSESAAQNTPELEQATIEVRNGTKTAGVARVLSDKLKAMGFTMLTPTDAQSKNYTTTKILISSDKAFPETIKRLLETTGGEVVESLSSEGATQADILIIVGK